MLLSTLAYYVPGPIQNTTFPFSLISLVMLTPSARCIVET
jgi:hypothetical protein